MQHFSLRDIEHLTGIKAHTFRMWEQRYGLHLCKRKKSLHRYYDDEDLKQILCIAHLYANGYRISRIAHLGLEELRALTAGKEDGSGNALPVHHLIDAVRDYDAPRFEKMLDACIRNMGMEDCVTKLIYPLMNRIGLLWMTGSLLPAHEHLCSCLVRQKILAAIDRLAAPGGQQGAVILLFTPPGEEHELPLLLAQYVFRKNGRRTVFFGSNTTPALLHYFCDHRPATHLYVHLITNFTGQEPEEYVSMLRDQFPGKTIVAAGPAFSQMPPVAGDVHILRSLKEMQAFAKES